MIWSLFFRKRLLPEIILPVTKMIVKIGSEIGISTYNKSEHPQFTTRPADIRSRIPAGLKRSGPALIHKSFLLARALMRINNYKKSNDFTGSSSENRRET